jgi:hypothetical protein
MDEAAARRLWALSETLTSGKPRGVPSVTA